MLAHGLEACRSLPGVADVRVKGAIGVVEMQSAPRAAALRQRFVDRGLWIRPFGKVVYLAPAFTIQPADLSDLISGMAAVLARG